MYAHVDVQGHSKIDFDKRQVRKALVKAGGQVRAAARRLVARKAISEPGDYPGKQRGFLQRSIGLVRPRSGQGYWIKVEPTTAGIKKSGRIYYPAVLHYGSKKRGIEPRENYMTAALDQQRDQVREHLARALQDALKPGK